MASRWPCRSTGAEPQVTAPIRALAVDDEPLAIERLQILCAQLPGIELSGTANDGSSALKLVDALKPQLLLLDIAMPGMSGLELAGRLGPNPPAIIFVTAFDRFAVAAFDVAAVDYLMKPVERERLALAVERAAVRLGSTPRPAASDWLEEFWVPHRGEIIRLAAADIDHIEAERDYMRLHSGARSFLIHDTITSLERRLDPGRFLRIHRSSIVRRDLITSLVRDGSSGGAVTLSTGATLPVGRTYAGAVREMAGR